MNKKLIFLTVLISLTHLISKAQGDSSLVLKKDSLMVDSSADTIKIDSITAENEKVPPKNDEKLTFKHSKKSDALFNTKFKTNGSLQVETFAANAQNPLAMNEPFYTRVWINPNVTLFGLPFTTDFYYTTEDNSVYNTNSFNITFNADLFKQLLLERFYREINERKKVDRMRQRDLNQKEKAESELQKRLEQLEKQIAELESQLGSQKLPDIPDIPNLDTFSRPDMPEMPDIKFPEDSLNLNRDSLDNEIRKKQEKLEKLKRDKEELESKIKSAKELIGKLQELRSLDSSLLHKQEKDFASKGNLKDIIGAQKSKFGKILDIASGFDKFSIGNVFPIHSDLTVMGTPVRGLDMQWSSDKFFTILSAGKAVGNDFRFFGAHNPEFDRNFLAATVGVGNPDRTQIYFTKTYFKDPESIEHRQQVMNSVNAIGGKVSMLKDALQIKGEAANSVFFANTSAPISNVEIEDEIFLDSFLVRPHANYLNTAYSVNSLAKLHDNLSLEASFQRVAPGYKTLGNPFLRVGFMERDFAVNTKFLKNRFSTRVFYKLNNDNLNSENDATNTVEGYGISAATHFNNKYPNFTFIHTPYQHGNNHPDSLLRSFNQFALTNITGNYLLKIKKTMLISTASYVSSAVQLDQLGNTKMQSLILTTNLSFPNAYQAICLFQVNSTAPGIDTLNASVFSVNILKQVSNKFTFGVEAHKTTFKNNAFRDGGKLMATYRYKKNTTVSIHAGYDSIYKLWGYEEMKVFSGRIRLNWKW